MAGIICQCRPRPKHTQPHRHRCCHHRVSCCCCPCYLCGMFVTRNSSATASVLFCCCCYYCCFCCSCSYHCFPWQCIKCTHLQAGCHLPVFLAPGAAALCGQCLVAKATAGAWKWNVYPQPWFCYYAVRVTLIRVSLTTIDLCPHKFFIQSCKFSLIDEYEFWMTI